MGKVGRPRDACLFINGTQSRRSSDQVFFQKARTLSVSANSVPITAVDRAKLVSTAVKDGNKSINWGLPYTVYSASVIDRPRKRIGALNAAAVAVAVTTMDTFTA